MRINFRDSDEEEIRKTDGSSINFPASSSVSRNIVMDDWCVRTTRRV